MKLLVVGGTGGTGREIVRAALSRGIEVNALVRSIPKAEPLLPKAHLIEGDARDPAATARALEGCDGVVSSLGSKISLFKEVTLLSAATQVLIEAMRAKSIVRLICITGMGAGDSRGHGGVLYDRIIQPFLLASIYRDKDRQEAVVRASGLRWTLVRPTVLTDKPATGQVRALTDLTGFHGGSIPRADVADFILSEFLDDGWVQRAPLITS